MVLWFPTKNIDRRWAEHFKSQFSNCQQPQPDSHPNTLPVSVWTVSNEPPTETEVRDVIKGLKLGRAAGPDDLSPALFETGNVTLTRVVTQLFESIWQSKSVPKSWGESTGIPIFKNCRKIVCGPQRYQSDTRHHLAICFNYSPDWPLQGRTRSANSRLDSDPDEVVSTIFSPYVSTQSTGTYSVPPTIAVFLDQWTERHFSTWCWDRAFPLSMLVSWRHYIPSLQEE